MRSLFAEARNQPPGDGEKHMIRKVMRKPAVLEATGWKQSTLYEQIAKGTFPKPFKLDPTGDTRAVGWWADEVEAFQERVAAAADRAA